MLPNSCTSLLVRGLREVFIEAEAEHREDEGLREIDMQKLFVRSDDWIMHYMISGNMSTAQNACVKNITSCVQIWHLLGHAVAGDRP